MISPWYILYCIYRVNCRLIWFSSVNKCLNKHCTQFSNACLIVTMYSCQNEFARSLRDWWNLQQASDCIPARVFNQSFHVSWATRRVVRENVLVSARQRKGRPSILGWSEWYWEKIDTVCSDVLGVTLRPCKFSVNRRPSPHSSSRRNLSET